MPSQFSHAPVVSILKVAVTTLCIQLFLQVVRQAHPGDYSILVCHLDLEHLLLIVLTAWAAVVIWNRRRCNSIPPAVSGDAALFLLRDRYARGEIDRDEFLQRRRDLEEQRTEEARGATAH